MMELSSDPLVELEEFIVNAALKRDQKSQKLHDEQATREKQRQNSLAIWRQRRTALATIVEVIDRMLKQYGYAGLVIGELEAKHSDLDRVLLKFAHGVRDYSKIFLCLKTSGEFTCATETRHDQRAMISIPIEQLSEERLKAAIAEAVEQCLARDMDEACALPLHPSTQTCG
jgi:hypothetical protein